MREDYIIKKTIRDEQSLRLSFNELAGKTFRLNFEDWYQNGYWGDGYLPYSIVIDDKVVANVSVSLMDFELNGRKLKLAQIGTVMTDKEYRKHGMSRRLIEEIEKDVTDKVDGIFLFANNSVLDFYPKFGFKKGMEHQYSKEVHSTNAKTAVQVPMKEMKDWKLLETAILESRSQCTFEMKNNIGLIMFYITKYMRECVFYVEEQKAYVIAEVEEGTLLLHNVYSQQEVDMERILQAFGPKIKKVTFGFTPLHTEGLHCEELHEEDTTLFVKGRFFEETNLPKLMFQTLSHA